MFSGLLAPVVSSRLQSSPVAVHAGAQFLCRCAEDGDGTVAKADEKYISEQEVENLGRD